MVCVGVCANQVVHCLLPSVVLDMADYGIAVFVGLASVDDRHPFVVRGWVNMTNYNGISPAYIY
jgi:hypothetical protein